MVLSKKRIEELRKRITQKTSAVKTNENSQEASLPYPKKPITLSDLESQIKKQRLEDEYNFSKSVQVVFHKIVIWSLILVYAVTFIGLIIIIIHWFWIDDFESFESFIWTILKMLSGAILFKLAEYGIRFPKG